MKPVCLLCSFLLAVALAAWPQTSPATPKSPPSKKSAATKSAAPPKAVSSHPAATKSAASTKKGPVSASSKSKTAHKPLATTPANYHRGQMAPTTDRYREIQQALLDRGYFKNEPNGVWDQQSSDALKQFQSENKLTPTGKLSSLSLIQLGLGPKHDEGPIVPPAPAGPPAAPDALPPEPAILPPPQN